MALESACSKDTAVLEVIELVKTLHSYVEGSAKRHHFFQNLQDETITTLKRLCETRWDHRHAAFSALKTAFTAVCTFLEIQNDDLINKCGATASGLLKKIKNFKFIFYIEVLYRCFKAINTLSLAFQAVEIDIVRAQDYYKIAHCELVNMKFDNEFDEF